MEKMYNEISKDQKIHVSINGSVVSIHLNMIVNIS